MSRIYIVVDTFLKRHVYLKRFLVERMSIQKTLLLLLLNPYLRPATKKPNMLTKKLLLKKEIRS